MKIGILSCNDFSIIGGAERHIMDIARALDADVVVPEYDETITHPYDPEHRIRFVSLYHRLPAEPWSHIAGSRLYKGLSLDYDLVICTDDMAVRYLVNKVPHIYYMLTPRRALYDMYYPVLEQYGPLKRIGYWGALNMAKSMDRRFVRHYVKHFACISHTVRNRIFKVYQREAEVIYPCVHTGRYRWLPGEGYWLSAGRVDKWKRVEIQVEAFRGMPERTLLIAGSIYPAYRDMVSRAPPNVRFLGNVDEEGLIDLYARSEGFLTTAIDEDFGITPVEAMASGKPVIATKEGGYLETVIEGYTGLLIPPDADAVRQAVDEISADPVRYREACQNRARMFDYRIFRDSLKDLVEKCAG